MTKIWLYRVDITKDKNAKIDQISTYLTLHGRAEANAIEVQYQQIALHKNIKLDLAQAQVGKANYNYLEIYQDNKSFYFFIDKANWKSTSTVEFELTLDTVNTFANDFTFNKKTKINRQHKDRLKSQLVIDEDSLPAYDDLHGCIGHTFVIANEWTNEGFDTTHLYTDDEPGQMTLIKYQNNKITGEWNNIWFVGRVADSQTGYYYWQVYDYDGDFFYYSDDEMKADNANNIYWAIRFDDDSEIYTENSAWTSLFVGEANIELYRLVDQVPEGFNPPQFKDAEEIKVDDATGTSWNLVYQNRNSYDSTDPDAYNQNNVIDCYLYPDRPMTIKLTTDKFYSGNDFTTGQHYFWLPEDCTTAAINGITGEKVVHRNKNTVAPNGRMMVMLGNITGQRKVVGECTVGSAYTNSFKFFEIYNDGTNVYFVQYQVVANAFGTDIKKLSESSVSSSYTYINFSPTDTDISSGIWLRPNNYAARLNGRPPTNQGLVSFLNRIYIALVSDSSRRVEFYANTTDTTVALDSVNAVDRTDTRILKIINLPYCPLNIFTDVFDGTGWIYDSNNQCLKLNNLIKEMQTDIAVNFNPVGVLHLNEYEQPGTNIVRDDFYESKIYNSEFYVPKFVYDSFNYQYQLENINEDTAKDNNVITFKTTNTINSKLLFDLNLNLKRSTSDYDGLCLVSRNNELTLFNSAYLNYIRNGYNYDVKNRNMSIARNVLTGVAGTVGATAALGGKGGAAAAAVGVVGGLATSLANIAMTEISADWAIKQKLEAATLQATTVSGSDDIDLLRYYTGGNKAKYVIYKCSNRVKQTMLDLFYYCGYKDDVYGVPNLNSRRWFNYIECLPVFNEEANTPYKDYLDDIKERYQAGITVYHRVGTSYNLEQTYENWEKSLY